MSTNILRLVVIVPWVLALYDLAVTVGRSVGRAVGALHAPDRSVARTAAEHRVAARSGPTR